MQGDGIATKLGGIMEVVLWLCALLVGFDLALANVPNFVMTVLGNANGSPKTNILLVV